jgi:hypothetical protein
MRARRTIATLSSATLALTAAMLTSGALSNANATGPVGSPAGTLTLSTSSPAGITYRDASNAVVGTQSIATGSKCALSPASGAYLAFSANTGAASYNSGSIGVASGNKTSGTACGQVNKDANEVLTVALNGATLSDALGPIKATSATLDLELKSDAWIRANLFDGTTPVGSFELQSGSSVGKPANVGGDPVFACSSKSDSGPDSGAGDNCRWVIDSKTVNGADFT